MVAPVGPVHPVVHPPTQAIDPELLVPLLESGVENGSLVRLAVARGILGIKNIRGRGNQRPFLPTHYAGREVYPFKKHVGLVVDPVRIAVFEKADTPTCLAIYTTRVIRHLNYPKLSVRRPIDGHGVLDQRLGSHQLHLVSLGQVDGFQPLSRIHGGRGLTRFFCWRRG